MAEVLEVNEQNFDSEIAKAGKPALVDFWAPWCGPCRMQTPILEKVAAKVGGKAVIAKVNVDEDPAIAARFQVRSIPTLLLIKDGQVIQQFVGVQQETKLVEQIEANV